MYCNKCNQLKCRHMPFYIGFFGSLQLMRRAVAILVTLQNSGLSLENRCMLIDLDLKSERVLVKLGMQSTLTAALLDLLETWRMHLPWYSGHALYKQLIGLSYASHPCIQP